MQAFQRAIRRDDWCSGRGAASNRCSLHFDLPLPFTFAAAAQQPPRHSQAVVVPSPNENNYT
eukprot:2469001-Rhodomonas_salina.1